MLSINSDILQPCAVVLILTLKSQQGILGIFSGQLTVPMFHVTSIEREEQKGNYLNFWHAYLPDNLTLFFIQTVQDDSVPSFLHSVRALMVIWK